jgi:hypothetical protein
VAARSGVFIAFVPVGVCGLGLGAVPVSQTRGPIVRTIQSQSRSRFHDQTRPMARSANASKARGNDCVPREVQPCRRWNLTCGLPQRRSAPPKPAGGHGRQGRPMRHSTVNSSRSCIRSGVGYTMARLNPRRVSFDVMTQRNR